MLASLRSSIDADTAKLDDVTREIGTAFTDGLTAAEQTEREGLQDSTKALNKARVAGESALAKAEAERSSLESELHEHLHKRQAELHEQIEALGDAEEHAEEEGDRKKALAAQKEKLKSLKKEIARVGSEQDDGRDAAADGDRPDERDHRDEPIVVPAIGRRRRASSPPIVVLAIGRRRRASSPPIVVPAIGRRRRASSPIVADRRRRASSPSS